jgi:prepilin-type N-terminal cleavage/methylation domain-containing protein
MKNPRKSKGLSLIELLISIIIFGIIVSTIPIFLQTIYNSAKVSNKEQVFFSEFSLLSLINTKYFDPNNAVGDNYYKDLNATGGSSALLIKGYSNGDLNRIGKEEIDNNILRSGSNLPVSPIPSAPPTSNMLDWNNINDFNGYTQTVGGVTSTGYTMHVSVKYIKDDTNYNSNDIVFTMDYKTPASLTNIKLIEIKTTVNGSSIVLDYPTCNIGASKLLSLQEISR